MSGNSNSGGRRAGAGRKPGAAQKRSQEIAAKVLADGKSSPLEVIVAAMRAELDAGNIREAAAYAEKAAPYMHPRLSSVDAKVRRVSSWAELSDAELASLAQSRGDDGAAEAPEGAQEPDSLH